MSDSQCPYLVGVADVDVTPGVAMGGLGVMFNRGLLASMSLRERLLRWPGFAVGATAGVFVGFVGWTIPGLAASGGELVQLALTGSI